MIARRLSLVVATIALAVSPAAAQTQQTFNPDEQAAVAAVQKMFEGMRLADSGMVRSVFASGARFASVDTRTTPASIRFDSVGGWFNQIANSNRRFDEQIYDVKVRVDGEIAQVWAPYTFYLDKAVRHCGVNAIDLLRDGTGWKVIQIFDTRRRENCPDPLKR